MRTTKVSEILKKHRLVDDFAEGGESKAYVGDGWADILDRTFTRMSAAGWDGHYQQIKQKFGRLVIYLPKPSEEIKKIIAQAESEALDICERCGDKAPCAACNANRNPSPFGGR